MTRLQAGKDSLERTPLGHQIADRVRDAILSGELAAGVHLTQQELCQRFGTSRMPARDALLQLTFEGFVVDEGAGRVRVAPISRTDVLDLFRIEGRIHALACRLLAERGSSSEIAQLSDVAKAMRAAIRDGNDDLTVDRHQEFHRLINVYARSVKLRSALKPLSQQIPRDFVIRVPGWTRKAMTMHREVVEALRDREADTAEHIMLAHTEAAGVRYVSLLEEGGAFKGQ